MTLTKTQAGDRSVCKAPVCRADIVWRKNVKTGKLSPYNLDGTSHFSTCPVAKVFRRRNK